MRRLCGEGSRSYLGRSRLVPENEVSAKPKGDVERRSEKSAEVVVVDWPAAEAVNHGEGPNEKEC